MDSLFLSESWAGLSILVRFLKHGRWLGLARRAAIIATQQDLFQLMNDPKIIDEKSLAWPFSRDSTHPLALEALVARCLASALYHGRELPCWDP